MTDYKVVRAVDGSLQVIHRQKECTDVTVTRGVVDRPAADRLAASSNMLKACEAVVEHSDFEDQTRTPGTQRLVMDCVRAAITMARGGK